MVEYLAPVHPGEILKQDFLSPMGISQYRLAKEIYLSQHCISKIVNGKASITADTALRLSLFFSTTPDLWLNLQKQYDIKIAQIELEKRKIKINAFELVTS